MQRVFIVKKTTERGTLFLPITSALLKIIKLKIELPNTVYEANLISSSEKYEFKNGFSKFINKKIEIKINNMKTFGIKNSELFSLGLLETKIG